MKIATLFAKDKTFCSTKLNDMQKEANIVILTDFEQLQATNSLCSSQMCSVSLPCKFFKCVTATFSYAFKMFI